MLLHIGSRDGIWDDHGVIRMVICAGDRAAAVELSARHADIARVALMCRLQQALRSTPHAARGL